MVKITRKLLWQSASKRSSPASPSTNIYLLASDVKGYTMIAITSSVCTYRML